MASFILRRLLVSVLIIIAASFLMYMLVAYSADPLQDLREQQFPEQDAADQRAGPAAPARCRPAAALAALARRRGQVPHPVRQRLRPRARPSRTRRWSTSCRRRSARRSSSSPLALILAILLGVTIGIVTALRQYSGLDNVVTFLSFFLYSLPAFLVAVLLKEFVAIGFNDFLAHPTIPWWVAVIIGVVAGLIWQSLIGGDRGAD